MPCSGGPWATCLMMNGSLFLPCWFFVLRQPTTGDYLLFGRANSSLWEGSSKLVLPKTADASLSMRWTTATPWPCRDPPVQEDRAGRYGTVSYGVTAFFPWFLMCMTLFVHPSRMEFLFPVFGILAIKLNWFSILWGLLFPLPNFSAGKPDMELRTFPTVGQLLGYNLFSICRSPTWCISD